MDIVNDEEFRTYINDFESYLHCIGEEEPKSVSDAAADAARDAAVDAGKDAESEISRTTSNDRPQGGTTDDGSNTCGDLPSNSEETHDNEYYSVSAYRRDVGKSLTQRGHDDEQQSFNRARHHGFENEEMDEYSSLVDDDQFGKHHSKESDIYGDFRRFDQPEYLELDGKMSAVRNEKFESGSESEVEEHSQFENDERPTIEQSLGERDEKLQREETKEFQMSEKFHQDNLMDHEEDEGRTELLDTAEPANLEVYSQDNINSSGIAFNSDKFCIEQEMIEDNGNVSDHLLAKDESDEEKQDQEPYHIGSDFIENSSERYDEELVELTKAKDMLADKSEPEDDLDSVSADTNEALVKLDPEEGLQNEDRDGDAGGNDTDDDMATHELNTGAVLERDFRVVEQEPEVQTDDKSQTVYPRNDEDYSKPLCGFNNEEPTSNVCEYNNDSETKVYKRDWFGTDDIEVSGNTDHPTTSVGLTSSDDQDQNDEEDELHDHPPQAITKCMLNKFHEIEQQNRFPASSMKAPLATLSSSRSNWQKKSNGHDTAAATNVNANGCINRYSRSSQCSDEGGMLDEVTQEPAEGLPERGLIKNLLAQWREMETQRKSAAPIPTAVTSPCGGTSSYGLVGTRGSRSSTKEGQEEPIISGGNSVRDEIIRIRSQSCDPVSRKKLHDEDATEYGRQGSDELRQTGIREEEIYKSQPSLTKAIRSKFEHLDAEAHSSGIPQHKKDYKWQVKELKTLSRPGLRSGL